MATKQENPQKDSWWINELESPGVSVKVNELTNIQETSNLAENIKQMFYQAYKEAYNDNDNEDSKTSTDFQMALAWLLLFVKY